VSGAAEDRALERFNVRTIGPEPSGATPIEQEDLEGLIPDFVATRADLNQVEFENIAKSLGWAHRQASSLGAGGILDYNFMLALHRRMFGDVWRWAGTLRRRETNIGVEPSQIATQSRLLLDDASYWHIHDVFAPDELAARIHCRLVSIHSFPNGNGRCTRMLADLYLSAIQAEPFVWGSAELDIDGSDRTRYIAALIKAATSDDYADLIDFARGDRDAQLIAADAHRPCPNTHTANPTDPRHPAA
jgi:Fic-DOC domain mobile mystery protein B